MPVDKNAPQDRIDKAFEQIVNEQGVVPNGPIGMAASLMAKATPAGYGGSGQLRDLAANLQRAAGAHSTEPHQREHMSSLDLGGLPLTDVQSYLNGAVMSGRLTVSEQLEVHMWLAGDLTRSVGGIIFYKYSGIGRPDNEGWLSEWNLDEVVTVSAYHAVSLPELLKQAFIANPAHPLAPTTHVPDNQSPILTLLKNKDVLIPSFFHVLRLMKRPTVVVELSTPQLYNDILNETGFSKLQERNGYRFRTLDVASFLFDD